MPARPTSSCAAARPGASRPTSRPPTPGRVTSSATSVAVSGDTVVVGAIGEDSSATGVNGNRANDSATDCRRGLRLRAQRHAPGPSRPTSRPPTPGRVTVSACSVAVSGDTVVVGAVLRGQQRDGRERHQADNSADDCRRGLRLRAQRHDLDPAGLPQGLQHRGELTTSAARWRSPATRWSSGPTARTAAPPG